MAQPPFKADAIQIEPAAVGSRLIERDTAAGELKFTDPVVTGGITLAQLAGLGSIATVHIVGKSGAGAEYTTVQAAFDAVPVTASALLPHLIILTDGVYTENVTVEKDGVFVFSPGGCVLTNSGVADTVTYQQGGSSTPKRGVWLNVRIQNTAVGRACLKFVGGALSEVANEWVDFKGCDLVATGVGGYQIDALAVNKISIQGGNWADSIATTLVKISQVAEFVVSGVYGVENMQLDYDNTGAIPATATTQYTLSNIPGTGTLLSTLSGAGSLDIMGSTIGATTLNGDQAVRARYSKLGNLIINGTVAMSMSHSSRGTIAGTGSLAETLTRGAQIFAASASETVTFGVPQPDTNYTVGLECEVDARVVAKNKGTASFDIEFPAGVQTTTVGYTVTREV